MSMVEYCRACVLLCLVQFAVCPAHVQAHGALAIGIPESVAKDGFSIGYAWDKPNLDIARVDALRSCLDLQTASLHARGFCKIITAFSRRCVSIAHDPGGLGWGWAVEPTSASAQAQALRSCVSTVRKSCTIAASQCDTNP
jgi:hypothetical protein